MKGYPFFRHRTILFVLILITTNLFFVHSTSAQSPNLERAIGSEASLPGLPAELTAKDWDQITRAIQSTFNQQAYLKASNLGAGDYFGYAVAISGDTLVVGASGEAGNGSGEDNDSAEDAGAAYVFVRNGSTWTQQAYLKASNADADDYFGYAVAISADTAVVGAPYEDGDGNTLTNSGAAYVFVREGTAWTQQDYLKASNANAGDGFGYAVAISGDTVVVGARYESGNGSDGEGNNDSSAAGAAYVFVREGTAWTQQDYLKASNVDADDQFGRSVAISGDTVVVGTHSEDGNGSGGEGNNSADGAGAAYVFVRDGTAWTQQAYLKASNVDADDRFGWSVAISRDTIVVGAPGEAGNGSGEDNDSADVAGAAYVFLRGGSTWTQQAYLKASNVDAGDFFGCSVAISGDTAVVGAMYEAGNGSGEGNNSASDAGAAYVFVQGGTAWSQQAYLKASIVDASDFFGYAVAISGDTVVVGAQYEDGNGISEADNSISDAGAAYVFHRFQVYLPLLMR